MIEKRTRKTNKKESSFGFWVTGNQAHAEE